MHWSNNMTFNEENINKFLEYVAKLEKENESLRVENDQLKQEVRRLHWMLEEQD